MLAVEETIIVNVEVDEFFCIKHERVESVKAARIVFSTAFHWLAGKKYRVGICEA